MLATESLSVPVPNASRLLTRMPVMETRGRAKKQVATVDCPKSMVGRVIGKNGETIRALQNYSGALIQIDQTVDPMKVTISGTPESLTMAVSMVTDIVNGTFKGFAMLRQIANSPDTGEALCQPVYAPGYGLIPPSQVCNAQFGKGMAPPVANMPPCQTLRSSPVSPIGMTLALDQQNEDRSAADIILGLTNSIAQLSVDSSSQASSLSGVQPDVFLGPTSLSSGYPSNMNVGYDGSPGSCGGFANGHMGMGVNKAGSLKMGNQYGGVGAMGQNAQVMGGDSSTSMVDFHNYHGSQQLGMSSPMLEQAIDSSLNSFHTPKQLRSLPAMHAYSSPTPQQPESMYPMPPTRNASPQQEPDAGQHNCIRLRDPNGRSFFLDLVTGHTHWASDMESTDSYFMSQ